MLKKRAWPRHPQRLGVSLSGDVNWGVWGFGGSGRNVGGLEWDDGDSMRGDGDGDDGDGDGRRGSSLTWAVGWSQGICLLPKVVDLVNCTGAQKAYTNMGMADVM